MEKRSPEAAVIMAGGKGIRMRRLGEYLPKCALVVYDQPLIIRQIEFCRRAGVKHFLISVGPRFSSLIEAILEPLKNEITITLSVDRLQNGPANALLRLRDQLQERGFFLLLGDIYVQGDDFLSYVAQAHPDRIVIGTRVEESTDRLRAGCNVVVEGSQVKEIIEKPEPESIVGKLAWTGDSYLPHNFFDYVPDDFGSTAANVMHLGELLNHARMKGLEIEAFSELSSVVNLTTVDDILVANALEFQRIRNLRPDEKRVTWDRLSRIYGPV